jgi:heme A synthase
MRSHFLMLVLFAVMVSAVFAVLQKDTPREQIRLGLFMSAGFIGFAVIAGWIMVLFPLW